MDEDTKQLIVMCATFLICLGMIIFAAITFKQLDNQRLNCENVSRYNNTLQHDINLETVCK